MEDGGAQSVGTEEPTVIAIYSTTIWVCPQMDLEIIPRAHVMVVHHFGTDKDLSYRKKNVAERHPMVYQKSLANEATMPSASNSAEAIHQKKSVSNVSKWGHISLKLALK